MKILVPTAGPEPAKANALRIVRIAKKFNAEIIVVNIRDQGEDWGGDRALEIFSKVAKEEKVQNKVVPVVGEISSSIIEQARSNEADLIIMGATEGRGVASWVVDRIMMNTDAPVLILPWTKLD
ncbi:MAG: universal stress protein [Candidatus Thermoplasmatota archaeon]|nr:universal stress protein [Candidatus Thermoplasmatota archaeon]